MALHLPKPRSRSVPQRTTGLDGMKVTVSAAAAGAVPMRFKLAAGRTSPSGRTLRRWAQQNRIPDARTAELAQRRAAIARLGGVNAVAQKIGRSPSSVRKYLSGRTNELRNDAKSKLKAAKATDIMRKAGVLKPDGTPKVATIRVTGRVHVRNGDEVGYDYRTRTLDFGNSDVPFSAEESQALAAALANDDQARVVAILERHATLDYPENKGFDVYGDQFGFHFDVIDKLDVTWH